MIDPPLTVASTADMAAEMKRALRPRNIRIIDLASELWLRRAGQNIGDGRDWVDSFWCSEMFHGHPFEDARSSPSRRPDL